MTSPRQEPLTKSELTHKLFGFPKPDITKFMQTPAQQIKQRRDYIAALLHELDHAKTHLQAALMQARSLGASGGTLVGLEMSLHNVETLKTWGERLT